MSGIKIYIDTETTGVYIDGERAMMETEKAVLLALQNEGIIIRGTEVGKARRKGEEMRKYEHE